MYCYIDTPFSLRYSATHEWIKIRSMLHGSLYLALQIWRVGPSSNIPEPGADKLRITRSDLRSDRY